MPSVKNLSYNQSQIPKTHLVLISISERQNNLTGPRTLPNQFLKSRNPMTKTQSTGFPKPHFGDNFSCNVHPRAIASTRRTQHKTSCKKNRIATKIPLLEHIVIHNSSIKSNSYHHSHHCLSRTLISPKKYDPIPYPRVLSINICNFYTLTTASYHL